MIRVCICGAKLFRWEPTICEACRRADIEHGAYVEYFGRLTETPPVQITARCFLQLGRHTFTAWRERAGGLVTQAPNG